MDITLRISIMILTVLVGLAVGSFLNVVIYRLPNDMSLSKPASHCPKCKEPIKWYDNIPVVSYIVLRGKCRHCKEHISFRYPTIELVNTVFWFTALTLFTNVVVPSFECNWFKFAASLIAISSLICICMCDYDHMLIPDILQGVLLVGAIVMLLDKPSFELVLLKVIGFVSMGLLFYFVNLVFKLSHKKDGLGSGDIILVMIGGLLLGVYQMIFALLIACFLALVILVTISIVKKDKEKEYPFAVFLTTGILVSLFVGEYVINWYMNLIGGLF